MNEDLILSMARPYVKDDSITYEQFDCIYDMLSLKEQYTVTEILYRNGINLVDADEQIDEDAYILEPNEDLDEENIEEFQVLYDEGLFKDSDYLEDDEENIVVNKSIKQSNEILCTLIQQGNKQAVQDLCVKNKKLVDKCVVAYQKRYRNRLDFEDLEQVGYMGLIKAAKKFEIHQGNAFSTYAVWWIKQSISREIMDNGYAIRIPVHMMERVNKVARVESQYLRFSIEERIDKISEELSIPTEEVRKCLILWRNYIGYASLNASIGDEEDTELGEMIPNEGILSVEDIAVNNELRCSLETVMATLTQKEQQILKLRFGWDGGRAMTLEEVGKQFNVTRERIRQIEAKALRKLRHPSRTGKIVDYLD